MKKIIAVFAMMLAFGYTANAQQKKVATPAQQQETIDREALKKAVMKDITALSENMEISDSQLTNLKGLFEYKHQALADKTLNKERRDAISEAIEAKLRSGLPQDQVGKLDENPQLLYQLTH
ncbi:hypothetical protein [Flavobacterium coralii]|uniref:hypothetical protein n=1 Tax=Flavobacterium coralii TaxID=2838017 RepID=UPI000C5D08FC|nr:hypothetical protein [Flavobacterium sp.]|tara:strand:+ start:11861 stop:12226 length:366 start_codon:yes stop_codon:yes gene_type:complete